VRVNTFPGADFFSAEKKGTQTGMPVLHDSDELAEKGTQTGMSMLQKIGGWTCKPDFVRQINLP
jgi:hypothetical protein